MKDTDKHTKPTDKFAVIRDCCLSGNCSVCHGMSSVGAPMRVVHITVPHKKKANTIAGNWARYNAQVVPITRGPERPFRELDVPELTDFKGPLKELLQIIRLLVVDHGEDAVLHFDAGANNVTVILETTQ